VIDGDSMVTLIETVIWHDQGSETVSQRLRDVDEAHGMIQEVGSRGRVRSTKYRKVWLVNFKEEDVGGLQMVTTDEDRVLRDG